MKEKKIFIIGLLLFLVFSIVGCSTSNDEPQFIESGLSSSANSSEPSGRISTAVRAESKQEEVAKFTVYVGYHEGFADMWDYIFADPSYGKFVLVRSIRNEIGCEVSNYFLNLPNFNDENKYAITYIAKDNGFLCKKFKFKLDDSISLNEITIERGAICYTIGLLDETTQTLKNYDNYWGGVNVGFLYFEKVGNQIDLSQYPNFSSR